MVIGSKASAESAKQFQPKEAIIHPWMASAACVKGHLLATKIPKLVSTLGSQHFESRTGSQSARDGLHCMKVIMF